MEIIKSKIVDIKIIKGLKAVFYEGYKQNNSGKIEKIDIIRDDAVLAIQDEWTEDQYGTNLTSNERYLAPLAWSNEDKMFLECEHLINFLGLEFEPKPDIFWERKAVRNITSKMLINKREQNTNKKK